VGGDRKNPHPPNPLSGFRERHGTIVFAELLNCQRVKQFGRIGSPLRIWGDPASEFLPETLADVKVVRKFLRFTRSEVGTRR
jgi:hypothetical protein